MSRPRVLHVVGSLDLGGGQKLTALVAAGLDRQRFDVTVLNLGQPGPYGDYLRRRGVAVIDLGMREPSVRSVGSTALGLLRMLTILWVRPRWAIVHTHMFRTALLCAIPARLSGSRVFSTVHRIYYRWQPVIERALARIQEAIVVDSAAAGRELQARTGIDETKYVVIHNGIDVTEFEEAPSKRAARAQLSVPEDAFVITEVAHLVPHKGQRHLIDAFALARGEHWRLLLVGDGPDRPDLESRARASAPPETIRFLGARPDLPTLLAASDVVALPSSFEGFGIILAEAMYLGVPVIGTSAGGATEVVVDHATGYLIDFGDVRALADRLKALADSPALREQLGAAGRRRVIERFTQRAMAERYARLYDGALTRGLAVPPGAEGSGG